MFQFFGLVKNSIIFYGDDGAGLDGVGVNITWAFHSTNNPVFSIEEVIFPL
jgi:hypothetical protein